MFLENQVFRWKNDTYRLLKTQGDNAVLYSMTQKSFNGMTSVPVVDLQQEELEGNIELLPDPYQPLRDRGFEGKAKARGEANFELIRELTAQPSILGELHERAALVSKASGGDPVKKRKIYRLLNIYWLKGQTPNALLPEYGKRSKSVKYTKKPGRRFGDGAEGVVITDEIRRLFDQACRRHLLAGKPSTVADAYRMFMTAYIDRFPGDRAPTITQFRRYYKTTYSQSERTAGQNTKIALNKDKRPLTGLAKDIALGIGDCYEIDSTLADQSLVSEFDRSLVIGRPTVWSVADRASGLVVGIHVSMDPPSLQGALDALYNAVMPKKAFCARYDIGIEESDWPASGVPRNVVFDNAELLSRHADILTSAFGMMLHNAASYRADSKGTVEFSLGRLQSLARPLLPMSINDTRIKKAGGGDNRLEGKLTLREYTQVIILMALSLNERPYEPTPRDAPTLGAYSPAGYFRWALKHGNCCLRNLGGTEESVRAAFLVKEKATVSSDGICFRGFYYTCDEGIKLGWFDRGRGVERPRDMMIAADPDDVSTAWLFKDPVRRPLEALRCTLAAKSREYEGMTLFEAGVVRRARKNARKEAERRSAETTARRMKEAQAIVRKAEEAAIKSSRSAEEQIEAIPANKLAERILQSKAHPRIPPEEPTAAPATAAEAQPAEPVDLLTAYLEMDN